MTAMVIGTQTMPNSCSEMELGFAKQNFEASKWWGLIGYVKRDWFREWREGGLRNRFRGKQTLGAPWLREAGQSGCDCGTWEVRVKGDMMHTTFALVWRSSRQMNGPLLQTH